MGQPSKARQAVLLADIEILRKLPQDYGLECNQVNNLLITDDTGNVGYIEISEGEGEYIEFDEKRRITPDKNDN